MIFVCACVFSRLDYDRRVSHSYNFTIVAADNGTPSHRGTANVRVSVTNVNDEDPVFIQPIEHVLVSYLLLFPFILPEQLPSPGQLHQLT